MHKNSQFSKIFANDRSPLSQTQCFQGYLDYLWFTVNLSFEIKVSFDKWTNIRQIELQITTTGVPQKDIIRRNSQDLFTQATGLILIPFFFKLLIHWYWIKSSFIFKTTINWRLPKDKVVFWRFDSRLPILNDIKSGSCNKKLNISHRQNINLYSTLMYFLP